MYILKSSNQNKINEMKRAKVENLVFQPGEDLEEIDSDDYLLIAAYKAEASKDFHVVEDSILFIEDDKGILQPVVDIKFRLSEIKNSIAEYKGKKVVFTSTVAVKMKDEIYVQTSHLDCVFDFPRKDQYTVFGFNDVLFVNHEGKYESLHYFKEHLDIILSPRITSLEKLFDKINMDKQHEGYKLYSSPLPKWEGDYQK